MSDSEDVSSVLTNKEVWKLIQFPKYLTSKEPVTLSEGSYHAFELDSTDRENKFILDVNRGRIELKYTLQTRANTTVRLARLDVNGPHRNPKEDYHVEPDDPFYEVHEQCIGKVFRNEAHIHIYREGFGDRWAYPVEELFDNTDVFKSTFYKFLKFCNVHSEIKLLGDLYDYF